MSEEKAEVSPEQASEILRLAARKREEDCGREIEETLRKYNCALIGEALLSNNGVRVFHKIIAKS